MGEQIVQVIETSKINVRGHANLNVLGWERPEVRAASSARLPASIQVAGEVVTISCMDDCTLQVPAACQLTIERSSGDLYVRNISGSVSIIRVGGDLSVDQVSLLDIQSVGGDCEIFKVNGPLNFQRVGGDLVAGELLGPVMFGSVNGDLQIQLPGTDVNINARGDIEADFLEVLTQKVSINAGGDIEVSLPDNPNVDLNLLCGGDIDIDIEGSQRISTEHVFQARLGTGTARFSIHAGGDIAVSDDSWDGSHLADMARHLEDAWQKINDRSRERRQAGPLDGKEISDQIHRKVQERLRQAEERIQESMQRAEEKTLRSGRISVVIPPTPPVPPIPPIPPIPPAFGRRPPATPAEPALRRASEEERLLVLQMLQEKKITVEEADRLLRALEG